MREKIILSIFVITYNHEDYIRKALDSIISQVTNYSYEIIIGDDASTDSTPTILQEYKNLYPDKIKLFLRKKNLGGKGAYNFLDLAKKCQGKYVITLEGDDFWISNNKIDSQIRFLEKNPKYIGVAHNCVVVDSESNPTGERYPECNDNVYSFSHLGSNILPGQLTTLMYKNIYKDRKYDCSILEEGLIPTDRLIYFILISYGSIYCLQEAMSAYRHITVGGSSYSANVRWNYEEVKKWNEALTRYSRQINNKNAIKYADLMMMKTIIGSRKRSNNNWNDIIRELYKVNFPIIRYFQYLHQLINRVVLNKKIWA